MRNEDFWTTSDTSAAPQIDFIRVLLQINLFQLACMVESEEGIYSDIPWNAFQEVSLDLLILLVFISRQLAAELDNKRGKFRIFKQLRRHPFDQVLAHPLNVVPVDHSRVEPNAAPIKND